MVSITRLNFHRPSLKILYVLTILTIGERNFTIGRNTVIISTLDVRSFVKDLVLTIYIHVHLSVFAT